MRIQSFYTELPFNSSQLAIIRRQSVLVYQQFFRYLCRPDTIVDPEDLHAQPGNWNNFNLLGATLSQEIIESTKGDQHTIIPQTIEDFLLHLTSNLSETLPEQQPRLNVLYAILYASLPLRSIGTALQERNDTKSDIYNLYKKLLSITQEYMKRPVDMHYDPELDVSIDTILERTGDPFDVLAFITQASWQGSRNGVPVPNISLRRSRGAFNLKHKNDQVPSPTSRQTNIMDTTFTEGQSNISNFYELKVSRDIEQGISSSTKS